MTQEVRRINRGSRALGERNAFSLVELIIALLLLGILAAAAGPRIADSLSRYRADAAAERIVVDLANAQRNAQTASAARSVTFDPPSDRYTVSGVEDLDHRATGYAVSLSAEPYRSELVSADFAGNTTVQFDGYGAVSAGGTVVVGSGPFQRTIIIDGETGRGRIQ